jgi:dCTP diphosphatase
MNDKDTTIDSLKTMMKKFVEERNWNTYHTPKELAIALSIEANELLELFLFKNQSIAEIGSNPTLLGNLKSEVADVLAYLLSMCNALNIDLTQVYIDKMKRNENKYPTSKFNGNYEKEKE